MASPCAPPQPMAVAAVIPNRLSLVFHYGYEWRNDNDPGNLHLHANSSFDYVHYSWNEFKNQGHPEPAGRIA